jgi:hypothetical protein
MQIKEEAFDFARAIWADFIFFVDADNMLENPDGESESNSNARKRPKTRIHFNTSIG